jgi:Zn-dependent protease with chaperone function
MSAVHFSQIHPRAFAHPSDEKATAALERVPLLPDLVKKVAQLGIEKRFRAHHMCSSVLLGPRQLPSLWSMVHEIAERLGIPPPQTYISRDGGVNAFAFGKRDHSIVLTSQLVDLLSDRELRGVIAHEMGHILCQHMLYKSVGLALASGAVPNVAKFIPGLEESVIALFYAWSRSAEYSADRAALLILEDPEPLAECLSRLAGVPRRFETEFDLRAFSEQAKNYEEEANLWSRIVTFGMGAFLTHPEPTKRVSALLQWAESGEYRMILEGRYLTRFEVEADGEVQIAGVKSCPLCRRPVGQVHVCSNCGLVQDPRQQQLCPVGHVAGLDWKFCKACGKSLTPGATRTENPGS